MGGGGEIFLGGGCGGGGVPSPVSLQKEFMPAKA